MALVVFLVMAWVGVVVFGSRHARQARAAPSEVTAERIAAGRLTAKSYVVVRPARAPAPVVAPAVPPVIAPSPNIGKPARLPSPATTREPIAPHPSVLSEPERILQKTSQALVDRDRREVGRELMGTDGKKEGEVPIITMDYRRQLGWPGYVRAMVRLGGLFLVFDKHSERIIAEADFVSNNLLDIRQDALVGMSPRVREIHSELAIAGMMDKARQKYGPTANTLILLLPINVDFDIIGGIAQQLAGHKINARTVARVFGEYEMVHDRLRLRAREYVSHDSRTTPISFTIEL
jgi:hypothetical protein